MNISTSGVLSGNTSQLYATKNPLTFICNNTTLGDWYTTNEIYQKHTLWGDGEDKSEFDPCPKRWRVPPDASITFGDFAAASIVSGSGYTINAGRIYNNMAWFPVVGRRRYISGELYAVGNYGYCWSTSVRGTYAKALSFHMSGSFFGSDNGRAFGFSVRCVQE